MRRELSQLAVPPGYDLLSESAEGTYPPFFGDTLRVRRRYQSPHDLSRTCADLQRMAEGFASGQPSYHAERPGALASRCSIGFRRKDFLVGILAQGPRDPEEVRRLGLQPRDWVLVDAEIKAR